MTKKKNKILVIGWDAADWNRLFRKWKKLLHAEIQLIPNKLSLAQEVQLASDASPSRINMSVTWIKFNSLPDLFLVAKKRFKIKMDQWTDEKKWSHVATSGG